MNKRGSTGNIFVLAEFYCALYCYREASPRIAYDGGGGNRVSVIVVLVFLLFVHRRHERLFSGRDEWSSMLSGTIELLQYGS